MRKYLFLLGLLLLPTQSFAQNLVVWDFSTRAGEKNNTTASLTSEFEEALTQGDINYTVLERRNLPRLQAVINNEVALKDIGRISSEGSRELKLLGVSIVAFGELFDDIDSGDVRIEVAFQDFTGKKLLIKSILMRRGLLRDATSRRERMVALAQAISESTPPTDNKPGVPLQNSGRSAQTPSPLSYIRATGIGLPDTKSPKETRKYLAQRAAEVDARRRLAENVKAHIQATTTTLNLAISEDKVLETVDQVVSGARVVSERELPDGAYEVTLEAPVFKNLK
jgi:hypothetical protein